MAERIDIDGVRFRVGADLKDLEAGFKKGEQLGAEAGKKTGSKFSQAFGTVVSAVAGAQIVGAMKTAFDAANRLEKTMLGLQATAKLTGQSFAVLSKSVNDLAKDGVMNIDQAAQSMKVLAAQGVNAQKSFEFLEAAKKVSAFNNIVGDAGQGVQDFVKFLQTGSAELAENMDPSIVAVVKRLGGYAAVTADATKKQQLMNAVIEKGGKLTGDYDKFLKSGGQSQVAFAGAATTLAQTFGQKLQPAMAAAYNTGAKILTWVSDMIAGLDSTTVAVAAFGTTAFAGIATFAKGAALLPGIFGSIGTAISASLGTIGLVIAAIGVLGIAVSALYDKFKAGRGETMFADREKLMQEIKLLEQTGANAKLLADQKEKLKNLNAQIAMEYDPLLRKMGEENSSMERKLKLIKELDAAEKILGGKEGIRQMGRSEAEARIRELRAGMAQMRRGGSSAIPEADRREFLRTSQNEILLLEQRLAQQKPTGTGSTPSTSTITKADPEYRFIQARDQLVKRQTEYDQYIKKVGATSELGMQATAKYGVDVAAIRGNLRSAIAEYNEEKTAADLAALEVSRKKQVENIMELATLEGWEKKKVDEELQKMREANARKVALVQAESFARTIQGANMIAGGVASVVNAKDLGGALGGFGGISQGIGQFSDKFEAFGTIGQGLAAAGGVVSVLSGLFGKSDEQRAREAEAQKRRDEEAKALLELQANYQKNMLALQEAAARLPFENLTRQLRLIDIQAQSERVAGSPEAQIEATRLAARQAAIQGTLTGQAGTISGGRLFGEVTADPASLTTFLNQRAAQAGSVGMVRNMLATLLQFRGSAAGLSGLGGALSSQLAGIAGSLPPEVAQAFQRTLNMVADAMQNLKSQGYDLGAVTITDIPYDVFGKPLDELLSEITRDTATAESLLSVIEQQLQTQQEIQKNTKVTADRLSETPGRNSSIIDISRGFSRSLGAIVNPQLTNTGLPQSIAAAVLATDIQKSIQERTVKGIEDLVTIQRDSRELLSIIGKTLAGTNTANSALVVQLEDLYRRSMAA